MTSKLVIILSGIIIFCVGLFIGQQITANPNEKGEIIGLNHVGLRVADFDKARDFYENELGFPMTYKFNDKGGKLLFAYFQINKSTFIELLPADAEHPEGVDHFGLEGQNLESIVDHLHSLGISSTESSVSPYTKVNIAHASDVNGIYFELIEATEGSDLRSAMDNWKE